MSKIRWNSVGRKSSKDDILPFNTGRRQTMPVKTSLSAPSSANAGRRKNSLRSSLRAINIIGSDDSPVYNMRQDCIAWQTMSQHLSLQLAERRRYELARHRNRMISSPEEHQNHVTVLMDKTDVLKVPSKTTRDKSTYLPSNTDDNALELDEDIIEDSSLMKVDTHIIPMEKLVERFNSDLTKGLTNDIVTEHRTTFGENKLTPSHKPSLLWMFIKQLLIGFNGILWIATLFAFLSYKPFGEPSPDPTNLGLGVILVLVIVSNALFNFYQEVKSMKIVASFSKMQPTTATVKRNGAEIQINAEELVPGDIIRVRLGEKVPADCRIVTCDDLQVNTSQLTGESAPVICTIKCTNRNFLESTNIIFYSSLVVQGTGEAIVVNTGDSTILGHVGKMTRNTSGSEITGLHREINRFVLFVIAAALLSIFLLWITWAAWLNIKQNGYISFNGNIVNSIGMVVCFIPEGLPAAVTLVLTIVAKRMYKQKVMVKSLATVETFNSVSIIATDKTGTLTINQMTITALLWGTQGEYMIPIHTNNEPNVTLNNEEHIIDRKRPSLNAENIPTAMKDLILGACLCNNVVKQPSLINGNGIDNPSLESNTNDTYLEKNEIVGDAADVALYHFCNDKCSVDIEQVKKTNPRINILPFNSKNKFMITANILEQTSTSLDNDATVLVTLKGAPDFILSRCSTYKQDSSDEILPITEEFRSSIQQRQETLGKCGYRVIGMIQQKMKKSQYNALIETYKTSKKQHQQKQTELISNEPDLNGLPGDNYCFIGMFSLLDPARPEVPDAVIKARRAHIRVAMVTGDHPTTAASIAKKVNILSKEISIDHGIDTFKIEHNNETGQIMAHFMRDTNTCLETHIVSEVMTSIQVKGIKTTSNMKIKSNIFKRIWACILFYLRDPNQVKDIDKLKLIPYGVVVIGGDMHSMDDYMWDWVLSHQEIVFARTSPEQKLRIVMEFLKRGEVVAVTGDGTNDAPALKQADLGVAMAAGTDVAKEAGDMILLDNNFSSIITAIETGRLLSDNLKKVAIYLLPGGSWSEVIPVFFNIWLGIPLPLSLFLAIIFCMFNDVVNSLAMVSEEAEQDIMSRPPAIRHRTHLIDWKLLVHAYLVVGNIECFAAFFCFFWYYSSQGIPLNSIFFTYANYSKNPPIAKTPEELLIIQQTGQSIYYVALCVMQMFNLLATRTRHISFFNHNPFFGKGRNWTILLGILFSTIVCVIVVRVPWFNSMFKTEPVSIKYICPALAFGVALFLFDEIRKYLVRRYPKSFLAKMAW
ncbi:unnamed protein product [Adineta steineri]|uniref:Cation-transporting P-type ATPase N-terminal domain-containing protein n=1 Tax=Adineta steineri TaxID=433720 RepID=A0A814XIP8_9BILA|nr:unnamed protein product [Adineta steineri]CAF1293509.1 unnamed protein product [Adineta steineri]